MTSEINTVLDIILNILIIIATTTILALVIKTAREDTVREQLKQAKQEIDRLIELRKLEKQTCEQKIAEITRITTAAENCIRALEQGVIKLVHTEDNGEAVLLADGTIICNKERKVIWSSDRHSRG